MASIKRRAEVDYVFAVVLKQENKLIGDINYSEEDDDTYEIGYDFNELFPLKKMRMAIQFMLTVYSMPC